MGKEDFEIQFRETSSYSGRCFNCNEEIDRTDGPKFVQVAVPKQSLMMFHHDCYLYFLAALIKFREVFMDIEREVITEVWIN